MRTHTKSAAQVHMRGWRRGIAGAALVTLIAGCESVTAREADVGLPPGPDVSEPFPIDRGDEGTTTPGTYKGLPLRLVDRAEPSVSSVDGVIGVVCIGMSNSSQECDTFKTRVEHTWGSEINPAVRVINCARGGHAIEKWIDPAFDENLWERCIDTLLPQEGVRLDQVKVLYHKAADQFTTGENGSALPPYPASESDFWAFHDHLTNFAQRVPAWFPQVVAVYTSSRIYGGFAQNQASRGEPLSYEEGLALNQWLEAHPSFTGIWQGWGPYLWAPDCAGGSFNGSGVCYERSEFQADGVHPAPAGREKVASLIHQRLLEHSWYQR